MQNRTSELEGFSDIIAVACSGKEIFEFDTVAARETDSPETDVSIVINETSSRFIPTEFRLKASRRKQDIQSKN